MRRIILAPHLDDEVIGCHDVLDTVDTVYYYRSDYRSEADHVLCQQQGLPQYSPWRFLAEIRLCPGDLVYLPSRYDFHPDHREVRRQGLQRLARFGAEFIYYSVEMNTPWLGEAVDPSAKKALFDQLYPDEHMPNPKYWLFSSLQPYDEIVWAQVRFEVERYHRWPQAPDQVAFLRNLHRHLFKVKVEAQQHGLDRDLEYFMLQRRARELLENEYTWGESTSCEMAAVWLKQKLEALLGRIVRVTISEDGENGAYVE